MASKKLAELLVQAVEACRGDMEKAMADRAPFAGVSEEACVPIARHIEQDATLRKYLDGYILVPSAMARLQSNEIPKYLIERVFLGASALDVAVSFHKIAATNLCTFVVVQRLNDLEVKRRIDLSDKCYIAHPSELPISQMLFLSFRDIESGNFPCKNTAALVYRDTQFSPIQFGDMDEVLPCDYPEIYQELDAAIELLVLNSTASPSKSWRFSYVEDLGWPMLTPNGSSLSQPLRNVAVLDDEVATRCASLRQNQIWQLDKAIRLALDRLAASRSKTSLSERAIDLGSCLEILLMHSPAAGSEKGSEISFKMRIRAAWLLGVSLEERERIFDLVRKIYDLRSAAVHNGTIQGRRAAPDHEVQALLWEGDALCRKLVTKISSSGWPDWSKCALGVGLQP